MQNNNKSKSFVFILLSALLIVAFLSGCGEKQSDASSAAQEETVAQTTTVQTITDAHSTVEATTEAQHTEENPDTSDTQEIVVPTTQGDEPVLSFSAEFKPYKAIDTYTDKRCSLKEVFGSSYNGGFLSFNSNGSFVDGLKTTSANTGAYVLKNNVLSATYSDDKNMEVSVVSFDNNIPTEIIVNYGGYDVYFR